MPSAATRDFGQLIAEKIRASHRAIANQWLERLSAVLSVAPNDVFPSQQLLDHIPELVTEIADRIATAHSDPVVANTAVFSKARELGGLRFEQKASVHQLLREYRLLAEVLGTFVQDQFALVAPSGESASIAGVMNRLNEAVYVLMQTTVDTFVGHYTAMIEEQTERLDGFNRMASHELRQPLSSVVHAVELLKSPSSSDESKRTRFLDVAERNLKRLSHLLDMLGALARPESGGDNALTQTVDLPKIVRDVFHQLEEAAAAKGVALAMDQSPHPLVVDLSRLELILVNLISNGIKYRDPSKANPQVEVSVSEDSQSVYLHIRDNGVGIPEGDRSRLFRRFVRLHATRDRELGNDGLGLGLAIAADSVKAMGDTISFQSEEGRGTTFTVALPNPANEPSDKVESGGR